MEPGRMVREKRGDKRTSADSVTMDAGGVLVTKCIINSVPPNTRPEYNPG